MSSPGRLGHARRLLIGFVAITGVLTIVLGALAWRFITLEKDLDRQRIQQRLETATDVAVSTLEAGIEESERWLLSLLGAENRELADLIAEAEESLPSDSIILLLTGERLAEHPRSHLLYHPSPAGERQGVVNERLAEANVLEFQERDFEAAETVLRALARSEDSTVRAAALLGLGRVLRELGDGEAALAVYDDLDALEDAWIEDLPAPLLARYNRSEVLEDLGRPAELQAAAEDLLTALRSGRWHLTAPVYRFYSEQVAGWVDADDHRDQVRSENLEALAAAVDEIWQRRDRIGSMASGGVGNRSILWAHELPFVILESSNDSTRAVLIAGPRFAERQWMAAWRSIGERQAVEFDLVDVASGRTTYGRREGNEGSGATASESHVRVARTPAETGLPWSVHLRSSDPATEIAGMALRRNLLLVGLALVVSMLLTSVYFISRAVNREFEVARVQSDFVAAVSHEFRSPLTSMRHMIELLATERVPDAATRNQFYEVLGREASRLQRLVEQLLDFRRMDEGAVDFDMQPIDATSFVEEAAAKFRDDASAHGFSLEVASNGSRSVVRGDRDALMRALWNLLENAVRYSPDCTTVWLEVAEVDGDHLAIAVRDRGVGIPEDERASIFQKFVRGSAAQSLGARGTGLGLAMVAEIVRAHDGEIRLESEVGHGSTFTITLPLEDPTE